MEKNPNESKSLAQFFDSTTMSVHLREGVKPYAKKGAPGNWNFEELRESVMTTEEVSEIAESIREETDDRNDGFVEIERAGSTIIQMGTYRIVITRPPFSDGWEITAVRPVKTLEMEDYSLSDKMKARIEGVAEGMLIAGAPGMGKTTFSQALANFFYSKNKVVKTVEAPRDLQLGSGITQYAIRSGSLEEIHDILLLSRPDYTIYDEMRNTEDFKLFADMRLAGVGMVGVIHATAPVDAIQRFIGRVELGVIPHIIDTVIFIKDGGIAEVLSLSMQVKIPSGMTESDLARPIVTVNNFETGKLEYEIYSYGEETVVVPVEKKQKSAVQKLAAAEVQRFFSRFSGKVRAEMVTDAKCIVYVPDDKISSIIGKQGSRISEIEESLGISIDVRSIDNNKESESETVDFSANIGKSSLQIFVEGKHADRIFDIFVDGEFLMSAKSGKNSVIKVKKSNRMARVLVDAISMGEDVKLVPKAK